MFHGQSLIISQVLNGFTKKGDIIGRLNWRNPFEETLISIRIHFSYCKSVTVPEDLSNFSQPKI